MAAYSFPLIAKTTVMDQIRIILISMLPLFYSLFYLLVYIPSDLERLYRLLYKWKLNPGSLISTNNYAIRWF